MHDVVDRHPGPSRGEASGVQVDIDPAQPGQFGTSHPGGGDQQPQRIQAILARVRQQGPQLLGSPDLHLRGGAPRRGDRVGRVADQVAEADGVLEGPVQHGVDVAHRLGGQALAVPPGVGEEDAVEGAEVGGGEPLQLDVPEPGHDMDPGVVGVVGERGGAQSGRLVVRKPLLQQVAADRPLGRLHERPGPQGRLRLQEGVPSFLPCPKTSLGDLARPASLRIRHVLDVPGPGAAALASPAARHRQRSEVTPTNWSSRAVGT
jgi:hypothetical protein